MELVKIKEICESENLGIFDNMEDAINAAYEAQQIYWKFNFQKRREIIESIRTDFRQYVKEMSIMAVEETGMGRVEDKIAKNILTLEKTPGVEDITTELIKGDTGEVMYEMCPFGVIGAITPSTNPVASLLNNSISMLAGGNTIVFSPHPGAKKTSVYTVSLINKAIRKAGGPENLVVTVKEPSIENTNILLSHKKVTMICATGGPAIVKIALSSGKKAVGAGAGNPPALVDETADIEKAAIDIINGCSFDNNLPCIAEKEVIVVDTVADELKKYMGENHGLEITDKAVIDKLVKLVVTEDGRANKDFVGKNADYIMNKIGINIDPSIKVIFAETDEDHPFAQLELLMPIIPVVRVKDVDEGIRVAKDLEHGNRHTAMMHSKNIDNLNRFQKEIQTTIFVKNAPSYAGIGYGSDGYVTFTIAGPTGEGLTSAKTFTRKRVAALGQIL